MIGRPCGSARNVQRPADAEVLALVVEAVQLVGIEIVHSCIGDDGVRLVRSHNPNTTRANSRPRPRITRLRIGQHVAAELQ